MTAEEFTKLVNGICLDRVKKNGQTHPEDVMSEVLNVVEVVYELVSRLPAGTWNTK